MIHNDFLAPILQSQKFPHLLKELNYLWEDEQRRRQEFYALIHPDTNSEWINGEIVKHIHEDETHATICKKLFFIIENHLITYNVDSDVVKEKFLCRFSRNDYLPDICYFVPEIYHTFKKDQAVFPVPNFIIEVVSDYSEKNDKGVKLQDYEDHHVQEYWIVNAKTKTIEQHILQHNDFKQITHSISDTIQGKVIAGLKIELKSIF